MRAIVFVVHVAIIRLSERDRKSPRVSAISRSRPSRWANKAARGRLCRRENNWKGGKFSRSVFARRGLWTLRPLHDFEFDDGLLPVNVRNRLRDGEIVNEHIGPSSRPMKHNFGVIEHFTVPRKPSPPHMFLFPVCGQEARVTDQRWRESSRTRCQSIDEALAKTQD